MTIAETELGADDVQRATEKLKSLRDCDIGVLDAVACGHRAIPALRTLLFEREPSGIYQPRCGAVRALSILGAHDVLFDFLNVPQAARDPVERAGDDAVINAAARCLSAVREEPVFQLLLSLAERRYWPGVVGALATFAREEAIPYLVGALAEDDCRLLAEPALTILGQAARPALLEAAILKSPSADFESETSIRRRRSALSLLIEIGVPQESWPSLRHLVSDRESRTAMLACDLCLSIAPEEEWSGAIRRLMELLENGGWRRERDIEECLVCHYGRTGKIISALLDGDPDEDSDETEPPQIREVLLRVSARAGRLERRERTQP